MTERRIMEVETDLKNMKLLPEVTWNLERPAHNTVTSSSVCERGDCATLTLTGAKPKVQSVDECQLAPYSGSCSPGTKVQWKVMDGTNTAVAMGALVPINIKAGVLEGDRLSGDGVVDVNSDAHAKSAGNVNSDVQSRKVGYVYSVQSRKVSDVQARKVDVSSDVQAGKVGDVNSAKTVGNVNRETVHARKVCSLNTDCDFHARKLDDVNSDVFHARKVFCVNSGTIPTQVANPISDEDGNMNISRRVSHPRRFLDKVTNCRSEVTDCRSEVTSCRSEVTSCRSEVTSCRSEVTSCRSEVTSCRSEVTSCRSEVTSCRSGVTGCRSEVTGGRSEVTGGRTEGMSCDADSVPSCNNEGGRFRNYTFKRVSSKRPWTVAADDRSHCSGPSKKQRPNFTDTVLAGGLSAVTEVGDGMMTDNTETLPTHAQSTLPTHAQSALPTHTHTALPTHAQSTLPTHAQSALPTHTQSALPTHAQSALPTHAQSTLPTHTQSTLPTHAQSALPTHVQSTLPTHAQSTLPTHTQSALPTHAQSTLPTHTQSALPTHAQSTLPTHTHSALPTHAQSTLPTHTQSALPTHAQSTLPTHAQSILPTHAQSANRPSQPGPNVSTFRKPKKPSQKQSKKFKSHVNVKTVVDIKDVEIKQNLINTVLAKPSTSCNSQFQKVEESFVQNVGKNKKLKQSKKNKSPNITGKEDLDKQRSAQTCRVPTNGWNSQFQDAEEGNVPTSGKAKKRKIKYSKKNKSSNVTTKATLTFQFPESSKANVPTSGKAKKRKHKDLEKNKFPTNVTVKENQDKQKSAKTCKVQTNGWHSQFPESSKANVPTSGKAKKRKIKDSKKNKPLVTAKAKLTFQFPESSKANVPTSGKAKKRKIKDSEKNKPPNVTTKAKLTFQFPESSKANVPTSGKAKKRKIKDSKKNKSPNVTTKAKLTFQLPESSKANVPTSGKAKKRKIGDSKKKKSPNVTTKADKVERKFDSINTVPFQDKQLTFHFPESSEENVTISGKAKKRKIGDSKKKKSLKVTTKADTITIVLFQGWQLTYQFQQSGEANVPTSGKVMKRKLKAKKTKSLAVVKMNEDKDKQKTATTISVSLEGCELITVSSLLKGKDGNIMSTSRISKKQKHINAKPTTSCKTRKNIEKSNSARTTTSGFKALLDDTESNSNSGGSGVSVTVADCLALVDANFDYRKTLTYTKQSHVFTIVDNITYDDFYVWYTDRTRHLKEQVRDVTFDWIRLRSEQLHLYLRKQLIYRVMYKQFRREESTAKVSRHHLEELRFLFQEVMSND